MKKTALYCSTALTIFLVGMVMVSDLFLQEIPGTDPRAWDWVGSIALMVNTTMILLSFSNDARRKHDES